MRVLRSSQGRLAVQFGWRPIQFGWFYTRILAKENWTYRNTDVYLPLKVRDQNNSERKLQEKNRIYKICSSDVGWCLPGSLDASSKGSRPAKGLRIVHTQLVGEERPGIGLACVLCDVDDGRRTDEGERNLQGDSVGRNPK